MHVSGVRVHGKDTVQVCLVVIIRTWIFYPLHNIRRIAENICLNVFIFFLSVSPVEFKWHTRFWEVMRKEGQEM